jgi:HEPN domain-containing protein
MPHDPARVEETKGWFAKAAEDLRAATFELTASPPLTSDIAFHAQQAVEKSLKGFLAWHDRPFRKTHNLVELGGECVALDAGLDPLLRRAAPLTKYATRFRYPGGGKGAQGASRPPTCAISKNARSHATRYVVAAERRGRPA